MKPKLWAVASPEFVTNGTDRDVETKRLNASTGRRMGREYPLDGRLGVNGSVVSSSSGIWGKAPTENDNDFTDF